MRKAKRKSKGPKPTLLKLPRAGTWRWWTQEQDRSLMSLRERVAKLEDTVKTMDRVAGNRCDHAIAMAERALEASSEKGVPAEYLRNQGERINALVAGMRAAATALEDAVRGVGAKAPESSPPGGYPTT